MSCRAMSAVQDCSPSEGIHRLLLYMIADGADPSGYFVVATERLGKKCNIAPNFVRAYIKELIEDGEIIRVLLPERGNDEQWYQITCCQNYAG